MRLRDSTINWQTWVCMANYALVHMFIVGINDRVWIENSVSETFITWAIRLRNCKCDDLLLCGSLNHKETDYFQSTRILYLTKDTLKYHQISNISQNLLGNKFVDHSDVVGASPDGAAPFTSSFCTEHLASIFCTITTAKRHGKH